MANKSRFALELTEAESDASVDFVDPEVSNKTIILLVLAGYKMIITS